MKRLGCRCDSLRQKISCREKVNLRTVDVDRFALRGLVYYWYHTRSHVLRRRIETGGLRVTHSLPDLRPGSRRSIACMQRLIETILRLQVRQIIRRLRYFILQTCIILQCTHKVASKRQLIDKLFFSKSIDSKKKICFNMKAVGFDSVDLVTIIEKRKIRLAFRHGLPSMKDHNSGRRALLISVVHQKRDSFNFPLSRDSECESLNEKLNGSFKRPPIGSLIYFSSRALPALTVFLLPQLRFLCDVFQKIGMWEFV